MAPSYNLTIRKFYNNAPCSKHADIGAGLKFSRGAYAMGPAAREPISRTIFENRCAEAPSQPRSDPLARGCQLARNTSVIPRTSFAIRNASPQIQREGRKSR